MVLIILASLSYPVKVNDHRFILEQYKGPGSRYRCPSCNQPRQFTRYIDKETGEHLAVDVGKCNREGKCGYHKKPREYFAEQPSTWETIRPIRYAGPTMKAQPRPIDYLPSELITASCRNYQQNNLWQFFAHRIGEAAATDIFLKYQTGTANHWPGATAFWQVDEMGRARQCKVMQYDAATGKRVKSERESFVAFMGKKILDKSDANLQQCFFGAHLLPLNPLAPVSIVESEKTAMWMAHHYPAHVWLATGGKNGCRWLDREVLKPLMGRTVILFPDLDATAEWQKSAVKMAETIRCRVAIVDEIESKATDQQRAEGWDIMDFHLLELSGAGGPIQSHPETARQVMSQPDAGPRVVPQQQQATHKGPEGWANEVADLETYFAGIELPTEPVAISPGCTILNCTTFVRNHIATVRANDGNKTFLPFLERLQGFRAYCQKLHNNSTAWLKTT